MWAAAASAAAALAAQQAENSLGAQARAQRQMLAEHQRREVARLQAEAARLRAERDSWQRGTCEGCGAPWSVHPLMNANAKGSNECSYCRRPRLDPARLQSSFGLGALYGYTTVRPQLLMGGGMLVAPEDGR